MSTRPKTLSPANRARQIALAVSAFDLKRSVLDAWQTVRLDVAIIAGVTLLGAVPRLVFLTDIPPGFHGDEGWTGLDARRVLSEGWIGPYVTSALGQPTGPLYFAAPFVGVFGNTVLAVRLAMATLGIITVPVAYLTFRVMFNRTVGLFAAVLLALGLWHLHYSRIGFMVISLPLVELLTLLFLFLGIQTRRWLFFGLSGLAFGAGIYTYNAYPIFAMPMALLGGWLIGRELLGWYAQRRSGRDVMIFGGQLALVVVMAAVAALPMIVYASNPDNDFLAHHRGVSVTESDEWKAADVQGKIDVLWDRTRDFFSSAFWYGEPDGADGAGVQAMVDRASVVLMAIGVIILIIRWRQPASIAVLLMLALLPIASIITFNAMLRRSLGVVPFVAVLSALPLALVWDRAATFGPRWRYAVYSGIAAIVVFIGFQNLDYYFREFPDNDLTLFTFAGEITEASEYMESIPEDSYVYFYSARWSFFYETRLFLAPDVEGEDRSHEFGQFSLVPTQPGPVAYVFLDSYLPQADEVARRYPGGTLSESVRSADGAINYRAYLLPSTEGIAVRPEDLPPPPTPTPAPGGEDRDVERVEDFRAIVAALEEYRRTNGVYPDTGDQVQTLCVYPDDVGCVLQAFIDPIPYDPLGDAGANGYWYAGTQTSYTLYARRESETIPACPETPGHLAGVGALYCVSGP